MHLCEHVCVSACAHMGMYKKQQFSRVSNSKMQDSHPWLEETKLDEPTTLPAYGFERFSRLQCKEGEHRWSFRDQCLKAITKAAIICRTEYQSGESCTNAQRDNLTIL